MRLESKIITLQDLKDEELAFLLDNAAINITPSLHEGFGLSVLEGLKRGCPSLDHKFTSTSEISGVAGIHIDMTSVSEISNSLIYINQNPRKIDELRNRTKEISDKFTWQHTVNNLIDFTKNIDENSIV
jgi:mannosyltransferase